MLKVVDYFANKENGSYGDIYSDVADLRKDHPKAEIIAGYGVLDTKTGFSPIESADWYWTREEAQAFIDAADDEPRYYWDRMSDYDESDGVEIVTAYGTETCRIIDNEEGGVIAYAHSGNVERIVAALRAAE
jgi:hypothetical protein